MRWIYALNPTSTSLSLSILSSVWDPNKCHFHSTPPKIWRTQLLFTSQETSLTTLKQWVCFLSHNGWTPAIEKKIHILPRELCTGWSPSTTFKHIIWTTSLHLHNLHFGNLTIYCQVWCGIVHLLPSCQRQPDDDPPTCPSVQMVKVPTGILF